MPEKPMSPDAQKMRTLASSIEKQIPGLGFCLIVFPFNEVGGLSNYVSNAKREDMIAFLEQKVADLKAKKDFFTPNHN